MSRDFIQRLESGAYTTVSLDTIERLAKGLGVRTGSLLGANPTPREESESSSLQALAENLALARASHNWTLKQLSERSGCNMYAISHLEHRHRTPTLYTLAKLATALGISAEKLLTRN